jgi:hypothetical protein
MLALDGRYQTALYAPYPGERNTEPQIQQNAVPCNNADLIHGYTDLSAIPRKEKNMVLKCIKPENGYLRTVPTMTETPR